MLPLILSSLATRVASLMSERILLVGASSAIAQELARKLCQRGCHLVLAGRNADELESIAKTNHLPLRVVDIEPSDTAHLLSIHPMALFPNHLHNGSFVLICPHNCANADLAHRFCH